MPELAPVHQPWMYSGNDAPLQRDISTRLAPPYDIVTGRLRERLLKTDPANGAAIDVPRLPGERTASDAAYADARRTLDAWIERGVISPCPHPVVGVLRQTFRELGQVVRRHGIVVDMPLAPLGRDSGLYAHEETGSRLRGDRLALFNALRVQTSPVFGMYSDEEGGVDEFIRDRLIRTEPRVVGVSPDGTLCELWIVDDARHLNWLTQAFGSRDVIIADGHHRYASQLAYLDSLGPSAGPAARSCMMALVAQEDPGMTIRAVHHVFAGITAFSMERLIAESSQWLQVEAVPGGPAELESHVMRAWFERSIPIGLIDFTNRNCFVASTLEVDPLATVEAAAPEVWRRSAPVVCRKLIVEQVLRQSFNEGRKPVRRPVFDVADLDDPESVLSGAQLGVIMLPMKLTDVLSIAATGFLLPADSTFFWPKIPTGLLFKSLE